MLVLLVGVSCASPTPPPAPTAAPAPTEPTGTTPAPTPAATATPTAARVSPAEQTALDIRVWNGSAEVQVDGQTAQPGRVPVQIGPHHVAALVNGQVVAEANPPPEGGQVDLVVPPPLPPLAIIVENFDEARPQSGLLEADVVYETLAEGGITRFMAVYLSGDSGRVGPVRSLRHYFAFLAGDFAADVVHIGASPEGFAWRDAMGLHKLDESAKDPGVFRVDTRRAPHNAYTSTVEDRQFLAERGGQLGGTWGPLRFSPQGAPPSTGDQQVPAFEVTFPPWPYHVRYEWDAARGGYRRFMNNAQHVDAESGEQIAPASVVVQFTNIQPIPDDPALRVDVDLVGASGRLVAFSGGTLRGGTWSKDGPRDATQWRDAQGQLLVLPPGLVWVEIVPLNSTLTLS
jgi:Protein of unknown function (DUF3048) N-terminal domain/Protein of unknown function (DUF3048) C-terminal domain